MDFPKVKARKLLDDKRAVFGLTSVQQFFAIILGVALLAYVIVVIMGSLQSSAGPLIPDSTATVRNETGFANGSGYTISTIAVVGFNTPTLVTALNGTSGADITTNVSLTAGGILRNTTANNYGQVNVTYTYNFWNTAENSVNGLLSNTSVGITSFFTSINPVYAILAILVIILVLTVLVRVVTGGAAGNKGQAPQL